MVVHSFLVQIGGLLCRLAACWLSRVICGACGEDRDTRETWDPLSRALRIICFIGTLDLRPYAQHVCGVQLAANARAATAGLLSGQ